MLLDGAYTIIAGGDGISASNTLQMNGGSYRIRSGGGAENAAPHTGDMFDRGMGSAWNGDKQRSQESGTASVESTGDTNSTESCKGIKATGALCITGGTFDLDTADDSLHTNGDFLISGGTISAASGDDGIHADGSLIIAGGDIRITESYEGIEGARIEMTGGTVQLVSSDDGFNAIGTGGESDFANAGKGMFSADATAEIILSGGKLMIDAGGDGLDSNGNLTVSGGEIYIEGPTNSGNGALDYDGEGVITGGTFVASGSSGMAVNFGNASTQGCMLVNLSVSQGDADLMLKDADGNVLLSHTITKMFDSIVISIPQLQAGNTYTLVTGAFSTEIEMTSLVYGSAGQGFGVGRGGMGFDKGGHPGDRTNGGKPMFGDQIPGEDGERPAMPETPDMQQSPENPAPPAMPDGNFSGNGSDM